jgi:hypothetical protein
MRMTTIKTSETSVGALVQRLYPTLTESQRQEAASALLKANPHLIDSAAFSPGTVVTLPEVQTFKPKANTASDDPLTETLDLLNDALKVHREQAASRIATALDNLAVQEETLKSGDIAEALKRSPAAAEIAKGLTNTLKLQKKKLAEEKQAQAVLFDRIAEDLDTLFK